MKKLNRTYVLGVLGLLLAAWIAWQTSKVPMRLVSNEPGPRFFPYVSAAGIALFSILTMIFDGPKEAKNGSKPYLDKAGWIRLIVIIAETIVFALGMYYLGFWIAGMLGTFMFIWTLKRNKKISIPVAILICVALSSICYFGFTRGFHIPLPKGELWNAIGIAMP